MKLERENKKRLIIYQNSLITTLILLAVLNVFFIVYDILFAFFTEKEFEAPDVIISVLCLALTMFLIVVEIINTFKSKKKGSLFIYRLLYDEDNVINKRFFIVTIVLNILFLTLFIYSLLAFISPIFPFFDFIEPMLSLIVMFGAIFYFDTLFVLLFKNVAYLDKSYNQKRKG